ncbi:MAG: hypothetical protein UT93_C0010G0015 [Candidatus Woesebacteria bacterium GW2011_GWF1_40_24]|uniref:LTD domain-containing protein n=1 Tax=Candidatus Woesebacteria bacterium GW2011_GWF1_40_24 TaxID=1618601 RepID=A0A0G0V053_9BACT|nr:MAG: hypothetical protein UT93_C0010G0015 [Candidatus Woesebacteria bacterium GW2011_GWF1_40_24]
MRKFTLFVVGLLVVCSIFPQKVKAQVVINEFVANGTPEWVEFYNSSPSADYIKNYYLDDDQNFLDDTGSGTKKLLTSLNTLNPTFPYFETTSFFNNSGDWIILFDQNGMMLDQFQYTSDPGRDFPIGRFPDSTGSFLMLSYSTKADGNSSPPTPVPTPTPTPVNIQKHRSQPPAVHRKGRSKSQQRPLSWVLRQTQPHTIRCLLPIKQKTIKIR